MFSLRERKLLAYIAVLVSQALPVDGFWRHTCHGQLGVARVDPLMSPGKPSQHAHTLHGASNLGFSATATSLMASNCSSCSIIQDKSGYWTPLMYFHHDNGTFEPVPQQGGMTAYYFTELTDGASVYVTNLTAFPKGFSMIAGTSTKRHFDGPIPDPGTSFWTPLDMSQSRLAEKAVGFNCLNYQGKTEGALEYHYLRNKSFVDQWCASGVRAELQFPSCWNGVDLDSPDHKGHVLYPNLGKTGQCPDGFAHRLPVLFYETIYNTQNYVNDSGQFVMSNGDPTGFGYHGDFIAGWDDGILQEAIDNSFCTHLNSSGLQSDCPVFDFYTDAQVAECKMDIPEALKDDQTTGLIEFLPNHMPICSTDAPPCPVPGQPSASVFAAPSSATAAYGLPANTTAVSVAPTPTAEATPTTTAMSSAQAPNQTITSTSIFTSNGVTIEMVIFEEVFTVTVTASDAMPATATATAGITGGASKRDGGRNFKNHKHKHHAARNAGNI